MKNDDLEVLARTIYGEARGEGKKGMEAVANVILNRTKAQKWFTGYKIVDGKKIPSILETCLKKAQFSCWNQDQENIKNYQKLINVTPKDPVFCDCLTIANAALNGTLRDFTKGATYYHTKNICPKWAEGHRPCYECKNHVFYNDIK